MLDQHGIDRLAGLPLKLMSAQSAGEKIFDSIYMHASLLPRAQRHVGATAPTDYARGCPCRRYTRQLSLSRLRIHQGQHHRRARRNTRRHTCHVRTLLQVVCRTVPPCRRPVDTHTCRQTCLTWLSDICRWHLPHRATISSIGTQTPRQMKGPTWQRYPPYGLSLPQVHFCQGPCCQGHAMAQ